LTNGPVNDYARFEIIAYRIPSIFILSILRGPGHNKSFDGSIGFIVRSVSLLSV